MNDIKIDGSHWKLFERELRFTGKTNKQQCGKKDLTSYKISKTAKCYNRVPTGSKTK